MNKVHGFTLIELMVAVAVMGVLAAVTLPTIGSMLSNNRSVAMTNELVTALWVARSESLRRGRPVTVCSTTNGTGCALATDWATGWIAVVDNQTNPAGNPTVAEVLRRWNAPGGDPTITGPTFVRYQPSGRIAATAQVQFTLAVDGCTGLNARSVQVTTVGRPSVTRVDCAVEDEEE